MQYILHYPCIYCCKCALAGTLPGSKPGAGFASILDAFLQPNGAHFHTYISTSSGDHPHKHFPTQRARTRWEHDSGHLPSDKISGIPFGEVRTFRPREVRILCAASAGNKRSLVARRICGILSGRVRTRCAENTGNKCSPYAVFLHPDGAHSRAYVSTPPDDHSHDNRTPPRMPPRGDLQRCTFVI
jgi:hypothetical protein